MCHGVHLAVTDVLFPKKKTEQSQLNMFQGDYEETQQETEVI